MRVIFGQSNFPEMIDKSNFRACTCKQFGGKKAYRYRKKEYGFDSVKLFWKMNVNCCKKIY